MADQVPYHPKDPPLPDLPDWLDEETAKRTFTVPVTVAIDSIQVRLDTGDFSLKYIAGVQGIGSTPSTCHGRLPLQFHIQLMDFCKSKLDSLYGQASR